MQAPSWASRYLMWRAAVLIVLFLAFAAFASGQTVHVTNGGVQVNPNPNDPYSGRLYIGGDRGFATEAYPYVTGVKSSEVCAPPQAPNPCRPGDTLSIDFFLDDPNWWDIA